MGNCFISPSGPRASMRWPVLCLLVLSLVCAANAQEDEQCFFCHGEPDFVKEAENGTEISLFVNHEAFAKSIHGENGCTSCHMDITEIPHKEDLAPVPCGGCHSEVEEPYKQSLHGQAIENGDPLAPQCSDCHGKHDIMSAKDPGSSTNPIHVPETCGGCHAENAPVAQSRDIEQHDILQHYKQSIHGEGILKKGLTVTAVCSSCHTAHNVLPHTNPESTIHRDNVVGTCTRCHALIEQVHRKIIEGQLWEDQPDVIPVCIDCHQPHEARKVYYDEGVSDKDCMTCHSRDISENGRDLKAVDLEEMTLSTHAGVRCAQCHTGANPSLHQPCAPVDLPVDCSICHAEQVEQHQNSIHGQLLAAGDLDAPACLDCHDGHGNLSKENALSPTFPKNIPDLCGRCHREGQDAAIRGKSSQHEVIENYSMSIHGKGLLESGLVVTATCVDCHSAHSPLPSSDPNSTVNRENIPDTCGTCHHGIEETFLQSIHSPLVSDTDKPLPVCNDCHSAHQIARTDMPDFRVNVTETCGRCHEEVASTYFETYHGKVSKLGSANSAKCSDCHGAHDVLPTSHPNSSLSRRNIVQTCAQCHRGSHRKFAGYLTHATHHDPHKYPALFFTFWIMTALLVGTFSFFGLHTLAWLPRSFREMRKEHKLAEAEKAGQSNFQRFDPIVRQMHFVLIITFLGLAVTGMTLKFSYMPWAQWISEILGGFQAAGAIHRICAVIMTILFVIHLGVIAHRKRRNKMTWFQMLTGPRSLVPNWNDAKEFVQTMKWFLHIGPRPKYGEWTYWEKFDYFAVFWGIAIIGSTGFMLWFPEFCTRFIPGWFINVATIIHSDEALLATGFIFTIHFFNTHFRPEKFPMDMVMFTGRMSVEELKRERPAYYEMLEKSGELEKRIVPPAGKEMRFWSAIFGTIALLVGFSLVILIIWSMLFGYR